MRRVWAVTMVCWGTGAFACGGIVGVSREGPTSDATPDSDVGVVVVDVGPDIAPEDGGIDATTTDARPDFALPDIGRPDLGSHDFGISDLGVPDLGSPDFGAPDLGIPDIGVADLGAPDAVVSTQTLRLAHFAFGTPKIDFCAVPGMTNDFSSARPLLYTATGGAVDGLMYGQASSYFPALPVATFYSVRIIAGGTTASTAATACQSESLGSTVFSEYSIVTGSTNTFAAYGGSIGSTPRAIAILEDAVGRPGDGTITVRVFNGAPGVPVIDTGYNVGGSWVMGSTGTPYGSAHLDSVNTALGLTLTFGAQYVSEIPLIGPVEVGAFAHGTIDADGGVPIATGMETYSNPGTHSLWVVPQSATVFNLEIIDCDDTQPVWMSPTALYSPCVVLP